MSVRDDDLAERLGASIDYIEDHLRERVDLDVAARRAGFSRWHFLRLFQAATGFGPGEYIRRRRLSRAAADVVRTDRRLLEIALEAGYESQEAFTRAFTRVHGVTPAVFRHRGAPAEPFRLFEPRLPFPLSETPATPRFVQRESCKLIGQRIATQARGCENLRDIPRFWREWLDGQRWKRIPSIAEEGVLYGACSTSDDEEGIEYLIGVSVDSRTSPPAGFEALELESGSYAMFLAEGPLPYSIQELTLRVYFRWSRDWGVRCDSRPDLEIYDPRFLDQDPPITQLWVPLAP